MRRIAGVMAAVLAVVLVASQLVLPQLAEHAAAHRLTRYGGSADASISAFPAVRLIFGHGDSLRLDGHGMRLPTDAGRGSLDRLDRFGEVHIRLRDVSAGPLTIDSFRLDRPDGAGAYSTHMAARTTPRDVATFLGSQAGGPLGGLLGELAAGTALPGGSDAQVPLNLSARVRSRDGRRQLSAVSGAVAGIPAGPLVGLILDAVVRRL